MKYRNLAVGSAFLLWFAIVINAPTAVSWYADLMQGLSWFLVSIMIFASLALFFLVITPQENIKMTVPSEQIDKWRETDSYISSPTHWMIVKSTAVHAVIGTPMWFLGFHYAATVFIFMSVLLSVLVIAVAQRLDRMLRQAL